MPSNTKENGFETLIVDTLVNSNGYEQGVTTEYNKQYAIDEDRLFRFLLSTQKKAMDELHILDSDLEKERFFRYDLREPDRRPRRKRSQRRKVPDRWCRS